MPKHVPSSRAKSKFLNHFYCLPTASVKLCWEKYGEPEKEVALLAQHKQALLNALVHLGILWKGMKSCP